MHSAQHSGNRRPIWRRAAIGLGAIAFTLGLSAAPSTAAPGAASPEVTKASAQAIVIPLPVKRFPPTGRYIPQQVGMGDSEFAGHGPKVVAQARINGIGISNRLTVRICLEAKETVFDFTAVKGCSEDFFLFNHLGPGCVTGVSPFWFEELHYTDTDHAPDVFPGQTPDSFVREWTFIGDTPGLDTNETGAFLFTNELLVTIDPDCP